MLEKSPHHNKSNFEKYRPPESIGESYEKWIIRILVSIVILLGIWLSIDYSRSDRKCGQKCKNENHKKYVYTLEPIPECSCFD
jgi:hypothetical protein